MSTLILGGARSGKSRLAESLAQQSGQRVIYIATATRGDGEMSARIQHHRASRPAHWLTVEQPIALASTLKQHATSDSCLLVDCLTLWLSNLLCADDAALFARERKALFDALPQLPGQLLLVSNETGLGVVPMGALTRQFVDEAGLLHQQLAAHSERVIFSIAGLPMVLKGQPL
ncbi:MAG: bifunctional adenosylcobinamide kinase/adenosylcobinamide-phosphate guanylyltransferase [Pseudomonadota bacterium]